MLQKLKTHAKLNTKICHPQAHMNTQTLTQFLITFCIIPTIFSALGSTGILLRLDVCCLSSTVVGTVNPLLTAGPPPPLEPVKERIQMLKLVLSHTKYHISTGTEHCIQAYELNQLFWTTEITMAFYRQTTCISHLTVHTVCTPLVWFYGRIPLVKTRWLWS
jgi:hypothetical protein